MYAPTTFSQTLTFVVGLLYLEKRVSYRRLQKELGLDDETIEDVRHELIVKRLAVDDGTPSEAGGHRNHPRSVKDLAVLVNCDWYDDAALSDVSLYCLELSGAMGGISI